VSSAGHRRILAGRYRLDEVIGRGGMSTVYRATDLSLDRTVAVKVALDPLAEENPVYVARFKREARAAASLNAPGVATIYDAGADGATRYIVMEYVDGRDLSDLLRGHKPLEAARAANIAEQVADTLAAAHAAGIVHRDIKPGNIMVVASGTPGAGPDADHERVKVLDFGIARTEDAVTLTQASSVLGTAPYMSPEQAMGNPADARSDIYSLGCVLYEMLTGRPPFMAEVSAAVLHQHVRVAPKPPRELNPAIPPALDALVLQMLAKNPADRPQTAVEVRDRLAGFDTATAPTMALPAAEALTAVAAAAAAAADVPQMATVPQPASPRPAPPAPPATRAVPPAPSGGGRGPGAWAFLALIALVLLGAAVAYAVASGGTSKSTSTQSSHSTPSKSSSSATHSSTSHSSSTPTSSTSSSTPSSSSSTSSTSTTTTTTTTSSSTPTTTTGPPGPAGGAPPTPPGQGGTPPGKAKKAKKK
jgi:serine/threonine-protein kinase